MICSLRRGRAKRKSLIAKMNYEINIIQITGNDPEGVEFHY
jgi:hypothetical protein